MQNHHSRIPLIHTLILKPNVKLLEKLLDKFYSFCRSVFMVPAEMLPTAWFMDSVSTYKCILWESLSCLLIHNVSRRNSNFTVHTALEMFLIKPDEIKSDFQAEGGSNHERQIFPSVRSHGRSYPYQNQTYKGKIGDTPLAEEQTIKQPFCMTNLPFPPSM